MVSEHQGIHIFVPFNRRSDDIHRRHCPVTEILSYSDLFHLHIVGGEGYCYTWYHPMTCTRVVGRLWTSDRIVSGTSTWQHKTSTRDRHSWSRRDSNPQCQQARAASPCLRPRGHRDRHRNTNSAIIHQCRGKHSTPLYLDILLNSSTLIAVKIHKWT